MDRLAYDILLTLRCRRRYCPNSSCLAADIGQRPSYPATSCPTPLISPKRRNSMLKWVYRVWKFRTLREREREREMLWWWIFGLLWFCFLWWWFFGWRNFCGDDFLGCCGFFFLGWSVVVCLPLWWWWMSFWFRPQCREQGKKFWVWRI